MAVSLTAPTRVDVPEVAQSPTGGLLAVSNVIAMTDDRLGLGIEYYTYLCNRAGVVAGACGTTSGITVDETKQFGGAQIVQGEPFAVYAGIECDLFGAPYTDQAAQVLAGGEDFAVSRAFYETAVVNAVNGVHLDDVTAGDVVDALGALEQYAGENYAGLPVIHANRRTTTKLIAEGVVEQPAGDGLMFTLQGTPVANAAGYPNGIMFVTGQVNVWRGTLQSYDVNAVMRNTGMALAERLYAVSTDCLLAWTGAGSEPPGPPLAVTGLDPETVTAGFPETITVTGSGFTPTTVITIAGHPVATQFIDENTVRTVDPVTADQSEHLYVALVDGINTSHTVALPIYAPTVFATNFALDPGRRSGTGWTMATLNASDTGVIAAVPDPYVDGNGSTWPGARISYPNGATMPDATWSGLTWLSTPMAAMPVGIVWAQRNMARTSVPAGISVATAVRRVPADPTTNILQFSTPRDTSWVERVHSMMPIAPPPPGQPNMVAEVAPINGAAAGTYIDLAYFSAIYPANVTNFDGDTPDNPDRKFEWTGAPYSSPSRSLGRTVVSPLTVTRYTGPATIIAGEPVPVLGIFGTGFTTDTTITIAGTTYTGVAISPDCLAVRNVTFVHGGQVQATITDHGRTATISIDVEQPPPIFAANQLAVTVVTSTADETVRLYLEQIGAGTTIDWGDGTVDTLPTGGSVTQNGTARPHVYAVPGTYQAVITGTFGRIGGGTDGTMNALVSIDHWGASTGTTSMNRAFLYWRYLTSVARPPSTITNLTYAFGWASRFNQDISDWDVSRVTTLDSVFLAAAAFNQDIGAWDVGNVTIMNNAFNGASSFNQDIGDWYTAKVTGMTNMFYNAAAFNQDLSCWPVPLIATAPSNFALGTPAGFTTARRPRWGTWGCVPHITGLQPDVIDPDTPTIITVTGSGFTPATQITIDGQPV